MKQPIKSTSKSRSVVVLSLVTGLILAGCSQVSDPEKQAAEERAADRPISNAVGKATPVPSPSANNPVGDVIELPAGYTSASNIVSSGDILAVRSGYRLAIGTPEQLKSNQFKELTVNPDCGEVTATDSEFILACPSPLEGSGGGTIFEISADKPALNKSRTAPMRFTSAVKTSSGEIIAGSSEEKDIYIFRGQDSSQSKKITTGRKVNQLVTSAVPGSRDAVVFIDRDSTAIQGVDFQNNQQGAALRMGVGVGSIAGGKDGVVFAADTLGHQFGLYTDTDVLRLHQTLRTDDSPWAIAADKKQDLVWVSSNPQNSLQAFSYNTGVPVAHGKLNTIANVRSMTMTNQGDLILASDSESSLQVIPAAELKKAAAQAS